MYSPFKVIRQFTLKCKLCKVCDVYLPHTSKDDPFRCHFRLLMLLNLKSNTWDKDTMYIAVDEVGKTNSAITSVSPFTRTVGLQMSAFLLFTSS